MTDIIEKRAKQVAALLLSDADGFCEITSDIKQESGNLMFSTRSPISGAEYKVTVQIEEA